jgi:hypothetical protein
MSGEVCESIKNVLISSQKKPYINCNLSTTSGNHLIMKYVEVKEKLSKWDCINKTFSLKPY